MMPTIDHQDATGSPPPVGVESPRVLLVEDQREVRWPMAQFLKHKGFDVTEVADARSALDALNQGPPFQFLLTDVSLPDLDGRDLARQARAIAPATWMALVTGWGLEPEDYAGCDVERVFLKPVDLASLCRELAEAGPPTARTPR